MKINEHCALVTDKLLLVPYSTHHVPEYHKWMTDPELQAATASEPLSLEEEFAMQQSWRTDHDKLTFIICQSYRTATQEHDFELIHGGSEDMIGDINLFLFDAEQEEDEEVETGHKTYQPPTANTSVIGEIELMIARKDLQRQGFGRAALLTFVHYIIGNWFHIATEYRRQTLESHPGLEYLRVKINQDNVRSIRLFENVGFIRTSAGVNYFGEIELRWHPTIEQLHAQAGWTGYEALPY